MPEEIPAEVAAGSPTGETFEFLTAPRGAPDDLGKLSSMSPQLEKKLADAGIFHYWQLAAATPADVAKIDAAGKLGGRIEREGWVDQARALIENA
jgi:small subunit ribosomal protein S2